MRQQIDNTEITIPAPPSEQLMPLNMVTVPLEGANLIEASAGTGKTFTIANLYLRFILERGLTVNEILVVTFTEKATKELKERLRLNLERALVILMDLANLDHDMASPDETSDTRDLFDPLMETASIPGQEPIHDFQKSPLFEKSNPSPLEEILIHYITSQDDRCDTLDLGIKQLRLAVVSFDEATIFTIHGFCQRMLNENAFESGLPFDLELITDDNDLLTEIVNDFWRCKIQTADEALASHLEAAGFTRETLNELAQILNGREFVTIDGDSSHSDFLPDLNIFTGIEKEASIAFDTRRNREEGLEKIIHPPLAQRLSQLIQSLDIIFREMVQWQETIASAQFQDEISTLLSQTGIFNLPYKDPGKTREALAKLSAELDEPGKPIKTPPCIFSISHLNAKRAKKFNDAPIPEHALFAFVESLPELKQRYIKGVAQILISIKIEFTQYFLAAWQERKETRNVQTFNDILLNLRRALRKDLEGDNRFHSLIRSKIKAAMIDEFQDTDPVQFEIFKSLFLPRPNASSPEDAPDIPFDDGLDLSHPFPIQPGSSSDLFEPFSTAATMANPPQGEPSIPLFLIGDPKQSIYKFRGADIYAYLHAKQLVKRRWTLSTNYRSESGVIHGVNHLFIQDEARERSSNNPFAEPEIPYLKVASGGKIDRDAALVEINTLLHNGPSHSSHPALSVIYLDNEGKLMNKADAEHAVCDVISREIFQLVHAGSDGRLGFISRAHIEDTETFENGSGDIQAPTSDITTENFKPLKPSDIAVLVRSRKEAATVQSRLADLGIPSVIQATGDVFKSDEARAMLTLLLAIAQPGEFTLRPFLLSPFIGKGIDEMATIEESEIQGYYQMILELNHIWKERGFMSMFRTLMTLEKGYRRMLSMPGGERIITNILHLAELIHQYTLAQQKGIEGTLAWYRERLQETEERPEHEIHLERDADALQIITVHSSKGLEFNVIFCPFEWRRSFTGHRPNNKAPDKLLYYNRARRFWELDLYLDGPEWREHTTLSYHETLAENIRLFYVALTRARNRCYLVTGDFSDCMQSALNYLLQGMDDETGDNCDKKVSSGKTRNLDQEAVVDYLTRMSPIGTGMKAAKESLADTMRNNLAHLVKRSDGAIALQNISSHSLKESPLKGRLPSTMAHDISLNAKELTRRIEKRWGIASFSWLTRNISHGHKQAEPGIEDPALSDETAQDAGIEASIPSVTLMDEASPPSFQGETVTLPKGARTGLAVHEIFEKIDFREFDGENILLPSSDLPLTPPGPQPSPTMGSETTQKQINIALKKYGITHPDNEAINAERIRATHDMVSSVLTTPISLEPYAPHYEENSGQTVEKRDEKETGNGENPLFSLAQVGLPQRLNELEFFYPIDQISPEGLSTIFKTHGIDHVGTTFAQRMESLNFNLREGFMQGFVDLIFEQGGKYYLLDWKTNWLGENKEAYTSAAITESMIDACYILQYHIYTLAVHLWLASKLSQYRYETHFGGVIYAYVRGMDPARPDSGVYFDRPSASLIHALETYFGVHHD